MPGNTLLRRLGIERPSVIERATEVADSGLWLALRVDGKVTVEQLAAFVGRWDRAGLLSITDVVVPRPLASDQLVGGDGVEWFAEMPELSHASELHPLVPAAAKGAERLCRDLRESSVGLDETVPADSTVSLFRARAEREKSFVRCAKALLTGVAQSRIDRVSLWTSTPRVIAASRGAARTAGLNPGDRYGVCVPEAQRALAANLVREGESVRMWFAIDQAAIERAVGR
jgi:hypothetical protein